MPVSHPASGREVDVAAGPYGVMKAAIVHHVQGLAHQLGTNLVVDGALTRGVQL